jgi:hypothetical protein
MAVLMALFALIPERPSFFLWLGVNLLLLALIFRKRFRQWLLSRRSYISFLPENWTFFCRAWSAASAELARGAGGGGDHAEAAGRGAAAPLAPL